MLPSSNASSCINQMFAEILFVNVVQRKQATEKSVKHVQVTVKFTVKFTVSKFYSSFHSVKSLTIKFTV